MISSPVLIDTGPLVAICRRSQASHRLCVDTLQGLHPPLFTCWPVLTEAAYLLRSDDREVRQLLDNCRAGLLEILPLSASDIDGIQAVLDRYGDQQFQLADASLMYLAERENIQTVFTLDRRDFLIYRLPSGDSMRLLPATL